MYMAPRKYPSSRSNFRSQEGQRSCILGKPRKIDVRNMWPERHRGHSWWSIAEAVDARGSLMSVYERLRLGGCEGVIIGRRTGTIAPREGSAAALARASTSSWMYFTKS